MSAANDAIANAIDLGSSWTGEVSGINTVGATAEPGEPYVYSGYQNSVWFTWTAPAATAVDIVDTIQFDFTSTEPAVLGLYQLMPWVTAAPGTEAFFQGLVPAGGERNPIRVEPGRMYYVQVSSWYGGGGVTDGVITWQPEYTWTVGPWIERGQAQLDGSALTDAGTMPVVAVRQSGRLADWVADQDNGGRILAYDSPFARDCAFHHCLAGDLIVHYSGYDYEHWCPVGHFNNSVFADSLVGLQEGWDTGSFFLAAFYDMYFWQAQFDLSVLGAIRAWLPGPVPPSLPGAPIVVETEADPNWNGNLFSDVGDPNVRFNNEVISYSTVMTCTGASVQHGFTVEFRHWASPDQLLPDKEVEWIPPLTFFDAGVFVNTYPWFIPDMIAGNTVVDSAVVLVPGATTFPDVVLSGVGADLRLPHADDVTPSDPWDCANPSRDFFIVSSSMTFDSGPPAKIGMAADAPHNRDDYARVVDKPNSGVVTIVEPRYRYLYRNHELPDLSAAPGLMKVEYNPVKVTT